jgi:hypothetical protein
MKSILLILQSVAGVSGVCAILCLAAHCGGEIIAISERRMDDVARMDNWAWAGLILLALWMACQIGMIGL